MAVERIKSVRDTFLYESANKNGAMDSVVSTMMNKGIVVTKDMLNNQYTTIINYFKFPLKTDIMEAVDSGLIIPMMYPKGIAPGNKVPTSLPFILTKDKKTGLVEAIAIIDNYAKFDDNNEKRVVMEANKLYSFLEGAYIARGLQLGFSGIRHNTTMYTEAVSIYAHMFIRVLNKEYALNVDKTAYNKVLFLASKFFMINLLQMPDSDIVFNYAIKAAGNISPIAIKRLNDNVPKDAYKDIGQFIQMLSALGYLIINGLERLTVREYVSKYIRTYGNSSLFALEHLAYFIFAIVSTVNRAHITDVYAWEAALGTRSGDKVYAYITNAVKRP